VGIKKISALRPKSVEEVLALGPVAEIPVGVEGIGTFKITLQELLRDYGTPGTTPPEIPSDPPSIILFEGDPDPFADVFIGVKVSDICWGTENFNPAIDEIILEKELEDLI